MEISVNKDGEDLGPFTLEDLQSQLAEGSLTLEDYAWFEGCEDWVYIADVPGIQDAPQGDSSETVAEGIYIEQNETQKGPFPQAQLQTMISQGIIPMDTPAWMDGWADWATVAEIPGIKKPRVKISGAANPLASLSATGGKDKKDKKGKKKGKEDSKEEESSGDSKSKKGTRTRRKKSGGKKEKKTLKELLVPILALVLILVLLIGGALWAWITFFPGDEDDEGGGIFQTIKKTVKDEPPPEDPWDLAEWRRKRQK